MDCLSCSTHINVCKDVHKSTPNAFSACCVDSKTSRRRRRRRLRLRRRRRLRLRLRLRDEDETRRLGDETRRLGDETRRLRRRGRLVSETPRRRTRQTRSIDSESGASRIRDRLERTFLTEPPVLPKIAITDNVRNFNSNRYTYIRQLFYKKCAGSLQCSQKSR